MAEDHNITRQDLIQIANLHTISPPGGANGYRIPAEDGDCPRYVARAAKSSFLDSPSEWETMRAIGYYGTLGFESVGYVAKFG
ncbi:hypothetical protein EYZ11_007015 [Aspergillus tanneri]|uniref:Uncharacterized protein n=1 Tax=Aspergillus tanneri TaxID=1220188 RepID=A0A4S3JJL6_9EURO|nr:hypothetical protein EYZ11_007015 [Aspergillus tanneri]